MKIRGGSVNSFANKPQVANATGTEDEPGDLSLRVSRKSHVLAFNSKKILQNRNDFRIRVVLEAQEQLPIMEKQLVERLEVRAVVVSSELAELIDRQ